jgi:hypothetical protein
MRKTSPPGSAEAGEGLVPVAEAAHLPAPPAPGAATHTRARRVGLILGAMALAVVLLGAAGFLLDAEPDQAPAHVPPRKTLSEPSTPSQPSPSQPSFDVVALGNGWTRYVSEDAGFAIELPPGWSATGRLPTLSRKLEFSAFPGSTPPAPGESPSIFVSKYAAARGLSARRVLEHLSRKSYDGLVRRSELAKTQLSHGRAFVYTGAWTSDVGPLRETTYGFVHGRSAYTLTFIGVTWQMEEYQEVFVDVANSFDVTP